MAKKTGKKTAAQSFVDKKVGNTEEKSVALRVKGHVDKKVACTNYFFIRIIIECCAEENVP